MDIGRELVQLKRKLAEVERAARLAHASIDGTAVEVRDSTGGLRALLGIQADGTTAVNVVNGAAPPAPSTPTVAPALGGLAIGWDGTFAGGVALPLDWSRVEVHTSPVAGFTPTAATLQATIETAQGGICYVPVSGPTYACLLARNTSGAASAATSVVGPYSPKPVAGEIGLGEIVSTMISDGAITTPKLFANAVTTAKLDVGSVDATALAADAITGKTITGGTINGTTINGGTITGGILQTASSGQRVIINETNTNSVRWYNSANTLVANIDFNGIGLRGGSGAVIRVNPGTTYPNLSFYNAANTNAAVIDLVEPVAGDANLEMLSGQFSGSGYTNVRWRHVLSRDSAVIERYNQAGAFPKIGGRLFLSDTIANLGYQNDDNTAQNTGFTVSANLATLVGGRFNVTAPASALSVGYFEGDAAHTGNLLRLYRAADKFIVDKDGNTTAAGTIAATGTLSTSADLIVADTVWQTYTPTVAGQGTGTFTSRTGFYYKLGKLVFFQAEFVMNAVGTGSATVTITAPSSIYRTGGRQTIPCHTQSTTTSGAVMNGHAVALETGTGNVIDRISVSNDGTSNRDNILTGANLLAGARVTIEGWYREA